MRNKWLWISLLMLIIVTFVAACAQSTTTPTQEATSPAGNAPTTTDVEALIVERCSRCHSPNKAFNANYNEQQWSDVIDNMVKKGAVVSDEEKALMVEWLISR